MPVPQASQRRSFFGLRMACSSFGCWGSTARRNQRQIRLREINCGQTPSNSRQSPSKKLQQRFARPRTLRSCPDVRRKSEPSGSRSIGSSLCIFALLCDELCVRWVVQRDEGGLAQTLLAPNNQAAVLQSSEYLDSLDEELSNQPGFKKPPTKIVRKCRITSQTDPDSGYINHGSKRGIGYLMEATVDCKHGILTGVDVYSANEKESLLVLRHLERQVDLGVPMKRIALDRGYETGAVHRGLELLGITGYIPAIQFSNPPEKYGFSYDPQLDAFICPEGVPLTYHRLNCSKSTGKYLRCYQVGGDACMRCPKRPSCFDKAGIRRRVLASSCYPAFFRGHQRVGTPEYLTMMRLRKIWAEGSFSVLKREHCISRIRKRGILAATEECLLAAMALNLKRMVNTIFRYFQIYCSAGTTVGFSRILAFGNRSLIVHYQQA